MILISCENSKTRLVSVHPHFRPPFSSHAVLYCAGNRLVHLLPVMKITSLAALAAFSILLGTTLPASAQWQTQSVLIKPGWTAVYLHVDASYTNLDAMVGGNPGNPISEVWLWNPTASTIQYVTSPQTPITGSSQWATWVRNTNSAGNSLGNLVPNAAYLVHSLASTNYIWTIKGKPTVPSYLWTSTGINLIGFSTVTNNPPRLDDFLKLVPDFATLADVYQYVGGELGPSNPIQVFSPHHYHPAITC